MMRKVAQSSLTITSKDVAREVGLSQPTVSRILSGADGFHVTDETRKRVLDTARRLNYRPNALARSLRQRRTNVFGFYTEDRFLDAHNYFLSALIGGVQQAAEEYEVDILLYRGDSSGSSEKVSRNLMDRRIDGLFALMSETAPLVGQLRKASLPVVAITDAVPGIPSVVCDDEGGMRLLVDYLWSKGHRRIAFLRTARHYRSVEARQSAFTSEMRLRGANSGDFPVITIDMETSADALTTLRHLPNRPTAVCCWNDMTAFDLLRACDMAGVRVPDDLAITGFDGLHDPKMLAWRLVTISAGWSSVASQAMHVLVRKIGDAQTADGGTEAAIEREEAPLITRLPVQLILGSTA